MKTVVVIRELLHHRPEVSFVKTLESVPFDVDDPDHYLVSLADSHIFDLKAKIPEFETALFTTSIHES